MINQSDFAKHTLKELDLRWHELEAELHRVGNKQSDLLMQAAHLLNSPDQKTAYWMADEYGKQYSRMLKEQSEIEEYLIENEAQGWTST